MTKTSMRTCQIFPQGEDGLVAYDSDTDAYRRKRRRQKEAAEHDTGDEGVEAKDFTNVRHPALP